MRLDYQMLLKSPPNLTGRIPPAKQSTGSIAFKVVSDGSVLKCSLYVSCDLFHQRPTSLALTQWCRNWGCLYPQQFWFVKNLGKISKKLGNKGIYCVIESTSNIDKINTLLLVTSCFSLWELMTWASEGFFPGGAVGDFPQIFFQGRPNVVKFVFYPSKLKKQPFFANNFKIQGGQGPPFRRPWLMSNWLT